ncbi:MAG: hypothetical protein A2846_02015 [Candidatus Doudnabacteria bacterium RIFCSPHIGHO2_01_FULL_49_9]|uniref:Uncharacterized protein n=1 Tax=Candidatus Doudnabacteria bacterium RIFCSPHIGHO2_01_FULL_49_9 TaxID=1817827 RepID=A0A1F5P375_9BACT|nr:MAG: hypothetical protein A2846_02015 [Candidatus Doudnabacteria bacterium RIFCSPHIGHO2_01_FULL_49_9]
MRYTVGEIIISSIDKVALVWFEFKMTSVDSSVTTSTLAKICFGIATIVSNKAANNNLATNLVRKLMRFINFVFVSAIPY